MPSNYERKDPLKDGRNALIFTNTFTVSVLLMNIWLAARDPEVGSEDTNLTVEELTKRLNKPFYLTERVLSPALWACNLLSEKGDFWHPLDLTFKEFLDRILKGQWDFDEFYNLLGPYKGRNKGNPHKDLVFYDSHLRDKDKPNA